MKGDNVWKEKYSPDILISREKIARITRSSNNHFMLN